ncbi:MAG: hypothetical protein DBY30_00550 [Verrucomicrobia bacterium]|nr:MAG: hypothetical protein DBY30_00550 [Verrucomicrobiota bacterium]
MAKNFCAILLAFGYAVLFVALAFVFVADNFYSYRDFGEFSYFSFVPFGFFAVCALAVYAALSYMRFLAPAAGPVLLGFLVFWAACFAHWGLPLGGGAQGGFSLSMRALSVVFLTGSPALFFACGVSILRAGRVRRAWAMFALSAVVFAYFCATEAAGLSLAACACVALAFAATAAARAAMKAFSKGR